VAVDERIERARAALGEALAADAAVTVAALSEKSDDRYLEVERRARATYAPGSGLGPGSGRFAVPGGEKPAAMILPADGIEAAPVFAIGRQGDAAVALVGRMRDAQGSAIAEALLLREIDGVWLIAGRMARGFGQDVKFESLGGADFDPADVSEPSVERVPASATDAAYVEGWGR
jgi:hypothetical protein